MIDLAAHIKKDIEVILSRAFENQSIFAFGDDGCGQYRRDYFARTFTIEKIDVEVEMDIDENFTAKCHLALSDYSMQDGAMCTDKNALLSLQQLLADIYVERSTISWASINEQIFDNAITLDINVDKMYII